MVKQEYIILSNGSVFQWISEFSEFLEVYDVDA